MSHFGFAEIMVILLIAILVINPKRIPSLAKMAGRWWRYFQNLMKLIKER